jgi:hypothetical protein
MDLFHPAPPPPLLLEQAVRQVAPPSEWMWQADLARWSPSQLMHQHVIWTLTQTWRAKLSLQRPWRGWKPLGTPPIYFWSLA